MWNQIDLSEFGAVERIYAYDPSIETIADENTKIEKMRLLKNKQVVSTILARFKKEPSLNAQIVKIDLKFFDSNPESLQVDPIGHANSVIVYRFYQDGKESYLCLRTEPHRHSNIYCRNSVRKAIRDVFSSLPNFYYLDFLINSREGLQSNEEQALDKLNSKDFDSLPENVKVLSPLKGNSGFCASWTMYTALLLLLNRNVDFDKLGNYLATFNLTQSRVPSEKFAAEFESCFAKKVVPATNALSCPNKKQFAKEIASYLNFKTQPDGSISYGIPYENKNATNYKYILFKHVKLYRSIIFAAYFVTKKLKQLNLINGIKNPQDQANLNAMFTKLDASYPSIEQQLKLAGKVRMHVPSSILERDTHKCDDQIFPHKDFCLDADIQRPIPTPDNLSCGKSKLKRNNFIILRGLKSTETSTRSDADTQMRKTAESLKPVINALYQKEL
jgi:hypothetical protein